jgi:hypothetical protein
MPKFHVVRTVFQVTEVEADNKEQALEFLKEFSEDDFETVDDKFELEVDEDDE